MNSYTLWENAGYIIISTPTNPHQSYSEGLHVIVSPKHPLSSAWEDSELAAQVFKLAADACGIMERLELAPWFNLQVNGNWGLLPGGKPFFHVHVLGRNRTANWGKPVVLPEAPGTYQNDPMPEADRNKLIEAFKSL